jgi:D-glycerate 3-kinase
MSEKRLFINSHGLAENYLQQAALWFDPIAKSLITHQSNAQKPLLVGINGCQGSGKTTLADYFSILFKAHGLKCVAISIDDFYLTYQQRQDLATDIHPLLATRGVPGTHDLTLALATINTLKNQSGAVSIPRFNKADDDRFPEEQWTTINEHLDIIILEGWCVGIPAQTPQDLVSPINHLESSSDADGKWRRYVNRQLESNYRELWALIDCLVMLKAPDFDCVYQWRLEQEQKLARSLCRAELAMTNKVMTPEQIKHFIQHYERLTRHSLAHLAKRSQHLLELDSQRQIISHHRPSDLPSQSL